MKRFLALLLVLLSFSLFAQEKKDEKKEEKKELPGKIGLEFRQIIQSAVVGNRVHKSDKAEAAVYSRSDFRARMDFSFLKDNMLTLTPFVYERLDLYFNPVYAGAPNQNKVNDPVFNVRNRVELGLDLTFNLKEVITLIVTPAFRFENNLKRNVKDTVVRTTIINVGGDEFGSAHRFVPMPSLTLGHKYKFGLDWNVKATAYVITHPIMELVAQESIVQTVDIEPIIDLGFDITKALNVKDVSFRIFAQEYAYISIYTPNYDVNIKYQGSDYTDKGTLLNDVKFGFNVGYNGLRITANYYTRITDGLDQLEARLPNWWNGLQIGAVFAKDKWDLGIEWTGMQLTYWGNNMNKAKTYYEPKFVESSDNKYFENTIEGYFRIRL